MKVRSEWELGSNNYSEYARTYKNVYLEREEDNGNCSLSVYRLNNNKYKYAIYVSYGTIYVGYDKLDGLLYVDSNEVDEKLDSLKNDLSLICNKKLRPNSKELNAIKEKYNLKSVPKDFFEEDREVEVEHELEMVNNINRKEIKVNCNSNLNKFILCMVFLLFCFSVFLPIIANDVSISRWLKLCVCNPISLVYFLLSILYFLRIKNYELIIKDKRLYLKNTFGDIKEFDIDDIEYYRIDGGEYYDSEKQTTFYNIGIIIKVKKLRIFFSNCGSDLTDLISFLRLNKVKCKKDSGV
jgi:hypothetical protein